MEATELILSLLKWGTTSIHFFSSVSFPCIVRLLYLRSHKALDRHKDRMLTFVDIYFEPILAPRIRRLCPTVPLSGLYSLL